MRLAFSLFALLAVILVANAAIPAVVVPLYIYPVVSGVDQWKPIKDAAIANPSVSFTVIVNPNSGPGSSKDTTYADAIVQMKNAGVKCIGYVSTNYGAVAVATVKANMDKYRTWYPGVSGFFLDEMANSGNKEAYYQSLTDYATSIGKPYTMGNPGTAVPQSYFDTVTNTVIYETSPLPQMSQINLGPTFAPYRSAMIVYNVPASALNQTYINQASKYVKWFYITDDVLSNPYDQLPSYWNTFIFYIAASATPVSPPVTPPVTPPVSAPVTAPVASPVAPPCNCCCTCP